jgi:hypothetical protein
VQASAARLTGHQTPSSIVIPVTTDGFCRSSPSGAPKNLFSSRQTTYPARSLKAEWFSRQPEEVDNSSVHQEDQPARAKGFPCSKSFPSLNGYAGEAE